MHSLSMGGAHSRVEAYIDSPTTPPYIGKQLTVLFHTTAIDISCVPQCSTNDKLHILVKA